MKKLVFIILLVGLCLPSLVFAADFARTLDLGNASGATGDTVWLPLTISGADGGSVGGMAFTLKFEDPNDPTMLVTDMFEVIGVSKNTSSTQNVADPQLFCNTIPCDNPYTTSIDPVGTGTLFFEFKDDGSGKALVAAAAAEPTPDNVILMDIGIQINGSVSTETVFNIGLSQTYLPQNTAAGYMETTSETSNPIPVLVGMPATEADGDGNFPVSDTFNSPVLNGGSITVAGTTTGDPLGPGSGDVDEDGVVTIQDVQSAFFNYIGLGSMSPAQLSAGDLIDDGDGGNSLSLGDVQAIFFKSIGL